MEQSKLEKLKKKLIADAQAEATKVIEDGKREAERIIEEAERQAEKIRSDYSTRAQHEASEHIRRQVSLRELEARKAILAEKGKIIDQVFEKALSELRQKDLQSGFSITWKLLLGAIQTGDEEIILGEADRNALPPDFIERLNKHLSDLGKRGDVKISQSIHNHGGGFILKRGRTETNVTFETLLETVRDQIETDIARILFENGETK